MRKRISPISLLASMLLFASNSLATPPDLASLDWSVKVPHNLAANPPDRDAITTFMINLNDDETYPTGICAAHFADLHHSDTLSLVVAESDGRFCHPFVVDKTAGGFQKYALDPAGDHASVPEIKDLDGNGHLELVVHLEFTGYEGAQYCTASWPVIYAWTGDGYSDVSRRHKSYYKQRLSLLQKEIAAAEVQKERAEQASAAQSSEPAESANSGTPSGLQFGGVSAKSPDNGAPAGFNFGGVNLVPTGKPQTTVDYGPNGSAHTTVSFPVVPSSLPQPPATPPPDSRGLNCTKAEAAKIERFLGISRDAGMSDAIRWKNSDNPDDRSFAAWVLADIATPEAMEDLQTLRHDPDSDVAISGKYALEQANQGPQVYAVDRQPVTDAAGKPIK